MEVTNQIRVDDCPAGPVLDAAVAKVLGWERCPGEFIDHWFPPGFDMPVVRNWSDDIAAAWELVEEAHFSIWCAGGPDKWVWGAGYWREGNLLCWSYDLDPEDCLSPMCEIAPLAITRAFLRAKGVEFVEIDQC